MRNPITPRNDEAPVGTAGITRAADAALRKSMKRIGQRVKVMLNKIPTQEITVNADTEYRYLIAPASIFQLADEIGDIIEQETDNGEMLEPYGVSSFNLGTTQAIASIAAQVATYPITPESLQFSQTHQARINIVRSRMFEEMQNLNSTMKANLNRILVQGISEGQNPRVIARQIYQEAGIPEWNSGNNKASFARALRVARTEINHAHREAGRAQDRDANALGIKTKLLWFSALLPTTRKTHARRHGHYYTREEVERFYSRDANEINCFHPDTMVSGRFVAGSKAWYEGRMVKIVTASGASLTVTPNHPVMSGRGLIASGEINKSDYLVTRKVDINNGSTSSSLALIHDESGVHSNLHGEHVDSKISEVFSSLVNFGHSFFAGVASVDFHGDGEFIKKDVQIVDSNRVLTYARDTKFFKALDEFKLIKTNSSSYFGSSKLLNLRRIFLTSSSFMASLGNFFSVFLGGALKPLISCLASVPLFKTVLLEGSSNSDARKSGFLGKLKDAFPFHMLSKYVFNIKKMNLFLTVGYYLDSILGKNSLDNTGRNSIAVSDAAKSAAGLVFLDNVVSVEVFDYSGHVYDLQEVSGLMYANSVMVSNCRCNQRSLVLNENDEPYDPAFIDRLQEKGDKFFND